MEKKSVGTFLAQGAAGNVIATYFLLLGIVLYRSDSESLIVFLVTLPIYLLIAGIIGAILGGVVWFTGFLLKRTPGVLVCAAVGTLVPILIAVLLSLSFGVGLDLNRLADTTLHILFLSLPAALMSGSRFNPLRTIVLGGGPTTSKRDFGHGFSFPPALLLRAGSVFGLLESLFYWACLVSSGSGNSYIGTAGEDFVMAIAAIVYFATVVFVSHWPPRKPLLIAMTVLVNAPLAIWTLNSHGPTGIESDLAAVVAWVFIFLWLLFAAGRMISVDNSPKLSLRRILPLTIWEIEIRHALNLW
jgi:hypothetical protein